MRDGGVAEAVAVEVAADGAVDRGAQGGEGLGVVAVDRAGAEDASLVFQRRRGSVVWTRSVSVQSSSSTVPVAFGAYRRTLGRWNEGIITEPSAERRARNQLSRSAAS